MLNKVTLIGNLGKDPEVRYSAGGEAITTISLATTERWKDKKTGDKVEKVEWHHIVFFNRLAEIAAEYLIKGSQIHLEGKLQTRKWQDKEGKDRYTTEIVANELIMLGKKEGGSNKPERPQKEERPFDKYNAAANPEPDNFDDDQIPF